MFETVDENILLVDEKDSALNCLRLPWQKTPGVDNILSSIKKYELVPLDSICTVV